MPRFLIKNGIIYNDIGNIIGVIDPNATEIEESTIEASGEALEAIKSFVDDVNSGSLKPRSAVKKFETILEKYPELKVK